MKKLLDGKYSGKPVGSSKLTRADKDWIRLCNALEILSRDGLDMNTVGATTLVDELQGYIDSKARPELLMSPPIASCISDMAINGECLRLGSHHPWRLWAPSLKSLTGGQVTQAPKTQAVFLGLWRSLISNAGPILQRYAPFRTKLSYPIAKKITKENTEAVRKTESILDDFWRVFDQATVEARKDTAVGKILATPRLLYRTSPWVEPASKPQRPQTVIFPSLAFDASGPQDSTRNAPIKGSPAPTEKPKKKTRGVAAPRELELNENHQAEDAPRMDRAPFKVNKRALKAFEVIFLTHSTDSRPGEIAWKEFLYAMGAIGFAPRKLMGSMWQFDPDPTKLGVERGIQLHEPHPSDKIQYLQARHHGRRLNRAYGWDSDMFALVEESNWIGEGLMA